MWRAALAEAVKAAYWVSKNASYIDYSLEIIMGATSLGVSIDDLTTTDIDAMTVPDEDKASAENRKTVRMMMADLYLTRDAKDRARIRIVSDETAEKRESRTVGASKARDRFEVVDGAGA